MPLAQHPQRLMSGLLRLILAPHIAPALALLSANCQCRPCESQPDKECDCLFHTLLLFLLFQLFC